MIDDFAKLIPESLKCKSGAVFFSGRTAFSNPSNLYILGINPGGGDPDETPESSISSHIEYVLKKKCAKWSDYRDGSWGGLAPGKHPLQKNVLHLINEVGRKAHTVPASEVVFLGSRGVRDLKRLYGKGYGELADLCWPFHEAVIDKLGVQVVACYGKPSGEYIRRRLKASTQVDEFVASYGKGKHLRSHTYRNDKGLSVVTFWFPGIGKPFWTNPKTNPTGLVVNALQS